MNSNIKKIAQIAGLSIFFILILVYAFFRSKDLIYGVKIRNVNIDGMSAQSGATIKDKVMNVTGNAKNAINLSLDGREILMDAGGNFNETIALLPGYNIINIEAKDKFGYVDEKNYKLMYKGI
jgi:hypothetical protein